MNIQTDKIFFLDLSRLTKLYPYEVTKEVKDFGVLEKYKDQQYTLNEINQIIAELMVKQPYIPNAMHLNVRFMYRDEKNILNYHQSITFRNYFYKEQERTENDTVLFLTEDLAMTGSL